jgi:hypothetical protein
LTSLPRCHLGEVLSFIERHVQDEQSPCACLFVLGWAGGRLCCIGAGCGVHPF